MFRVKQLFVYSFFPAALLFVVTACISQNNPWDPIHYDRIFSQMVRDSAALRIEQAYNALDLKVLDTVAAAISAVESANKVIQEQNRQRELSNTARRRYNDSIADWNSRLVPPSTRYGLKRTLDTLLLLDTIGSFPALAALAAALPVQKQIADTIIVNTNARAAPLVIFTSWQRDSLLARFDDVAVRVRRVDSLASALRARIGTTNADTIAPKNFNIVVENLDIVRYNDSISAFLGIRVIPGNSDSIAIYLRNAVAGNTFQLINNQVDLKTTIQFNNSGEPTRPIVVQGQEKTVLSLSDVVLDGNSYITFTSIEFTAGSTQCVLVRNGCKGIIFNRCRFTSSARGLTILSSDVTLNDCIISNGGGNEGIYIGSNGHSPTVTLNNVLIKECGKNAIQASGAMLSITRTTILRNGGEAIYLAQPAGELVLRNSLITNNGGGNPTPAIYFEGGYQGVTPLQMSYVNMTQNGAGQDTVNAPVSEPILHHDPMYVNEYDIGPASPLDSLEKAGITIGYRRP